MRHGRWVGAALFAGLVALVTGCGAEGGGGIGAGASVVATSVVPTAEAAALPVSTAASLGLDVPGSCPEPWLPVHAGGTVYNGTPPADWPDQVRPVDGPSIDVWARAYDPPDTDGDGVADVVSTTAEGAAIQIERGDGQLVLSLSGIVGFPGGRMSPGDLDGDGRDDLVVYVSPFATPARSEDAVYVVPGSVPTGTQDPRDVGVRLAVGDGLQGPLGVGDQDGDGADDVAWLDQVVPGPALLAPGPGGRLDERPAGIGRLPEGVVGLLALDARAAPVVVSALARATTGEVDLALHVDPEVVLRTARVPAGAGTLGPGSVTGWLSGGHRIVSLTVDGGRSGDRETWAWDLDAPCSAPTPA